VISYSKGQDLWATLSFVRNCIAMNHGADVVDFLEKAQAFDEYGTTGLHLCNYYKGG
jgi:hypothetical protein